MFARTVSLFAAAGLFASLASAHMMLNTPVPYGKDSLNNSPLNNVYPGSSGSDFPCKLRGSDTFTITQMNNMPVGVPQVLSFIGGATHGGGSCQVSLTTDKQPSVNSVWKVIHSIIGGCPASVDGNLSGNPAGTNAATFNYSIPAGVPNGQYSLAWTWVNHIGNREYYMNCAPVTVTGSSAKDGDLTLLNSLPDMFVVNLPNTQCEVPESVDFDYPHPGDSVETVLSTSLGTSLIGSGCATMTGLGAGLAAVQGGASATGSSAVGSSPATATASASAPSSPTSAAAGTYSSASTTTQHVTATISATQGYAATSAAAAIPAPTVAPLYSNGSTPSTGSGAAAAPAAAPAAAGTGNTPCPDSASDGALVCNGATQFGLCNRGYVVWQAVADGTTCSGGQILKKRGAWRYHPRGVRHGGRRHGGSL